MTHSNPDSTIAVLLGSVVSLTFGGFLLQSMSAILLGALGAVGGYLANRYIKPYLERKLIKIEKHFKSKRK